MPIYEYTCEHCHCSFELIQKVNDAPVTLCEACGKNTAVRLVSAPGFQLKGTGWYVTDFKNNKSKPTSDSSTSKEKKSTTTTEASSASGKKIEN